MLRELTVRNLALLEDVHVELEPGFCVWTGETGAGKSLLLGAIGLLLGERGSNESIRAGREELRVVGRFELTRPEQKTAAEDILQTTLDSDELILTRRITRSGRSTALVDEQPVSLATLRRIGEMLVDVHGQRESYSLLQPTYQLELLDAFGKATDLRAEYERHAEMVRTLRKRRKAMAESAETRRRELTLIDFEREELNAAQLFSGERESLLVERAKLHHVVAIQKFTSEVAERLHENDGSFSTVIGKLVKEGSKWGAYDRRLADMATRLEALKVEVRDLAEEARDYADASESDPARLAAIDVRLQQLAKLEAKYARSIDELVVYRDSLEERAIELRRGEEDFSSLKPELERAVAAWKTSASKLSHARQVAARKLTDAAKIHLADLGMPHAQIHASLESIPLGDDLETGDVPTNGADRLELMLAANPGEPPRPLRKVASGGETSRTLLALKTVLAAHDPVRTLVVFDEVDANVGGRLGDALGQKLAALGASHQVLCITHLPQVASHAAHHWSIRKRTDGDRTDVVVSRLTSKADRVEELALMLRGGARSATTRREAAGMLKSSRQPVARR